MWPKYWALVRYILGIGNQQERERCTRWAWKWRGREGGVVRCIPRCWSVRENEGGEVSDAGLIAGLTDGFLWSDRNEGPTGAGSGMSEKRWRQGIKLLFWGYFKAAGSASQISQGLILVLILLKGDNIYAVVSVLSLELERLGTSFQLYIADYKQSTPLSFPFPCEVPPRIVVRWSRGFAGYQVLRKQCLSLHQFLLYVLTTDVFLRRISDDVRLLWKALPSPCWWKLVRIST